MIEGFSDYEKTEVKEFGPKEKVELGGHICKVLAVNIENIVSKKDGQNYLILNLKIDLDDSDRQAGFYQRKFAEDAAKDALNAKWKGYHRVTIPTNSSTDFIKSNWKGFITSIEESNPGVKINGSAGFDENILVGKKFGGVFGMEEFITTTDSKLITFNRIRFARGINKIEEAPIPSVKKVDGTYVKYEDYVKGNSQPQQTNTQNSTSMFESGDDLPF